MVRRIMAFISSLYYIPPWFYGYDILLQLLFGIITLAVSFYSFKLYRISNQRELKFFSGAFFFISLSYIIWAMLNIFLISPLSDRVSVVQFEEFRLLVHNSFGLSTVGVYAHLFFFITGIITLAFMTFRTEDTRSYFVLITLILPIIFFSYNVRLMTYLIAAILLAHITGSYIYDFLEKKKGKNVPVLLAFLFLFFASLTFMYSGREPLHYAVGYLFMFLAYMLILINFIRVLNHGQKKKQA